MSMNDTTGSDTVTDRFATRPLHLTTDLLDVGSTTNRGWVSAVMGALGILVLGILVTAVVTVSHESSHPVAQARTSMSIPTASVVVHTPAPSAAAQPVTSWSVAATASTLAAPPTAAPTPHGVSAPSTTAPASPAAQREPSVRQRLHDMFPKLFPGH